MSSPEARFTVVVVEEDPPVRHPLAGVVAAVGAVVVALGYRGPFVDNQHLYLLRAVAGLADSPLAADPLVASPDPTPAFTAIARFGFDLVGVGATAAVLWLLAAVTFVLSLLMVSDSVVSLTRVRLLLWTAATAVVAAPFSDRVAGRLDDVLVGVPHVTGAFGGVANQYALGPYAQPSIAAAFAIGGSVVAVRRGRLSGAAPAVGSGVVVCAAALHPSLLPSAYLLVAAIVAAELWGRRSSPTAAAASVARVVVGAAVGTAIVALTNWSVLSSSLSGDRRSAAQVLVDGRVRAHALLSVWFDAGTVAAVAVVGIAAWLALRGESELERRVGRFLASASVLVVVATAVTVIAGDPRFLLAFPWRASVVIVPIAACTLIARFADRLVIDSAPGTPVRAALSVVSVIVIVAACASGVARTLGPRDPVAVPSGVLEAVADSDLTGVGMVPTDMGELRLAARRPLYVDAENHPFDSADVLDWRTDVKEVDAAMEDPDALCRLLDDVAPGWAIVPVETARRAQQECLAAWDLAPAGQQYVLAEPR